MNPLSCQLLDNLDESIVARLGFETLRLSFQRLQLTSSQADGLVPMCELLIRFFWGLRDQPPALQG